MAENYVSGSWCGSITIAPRFYSEEAYKKLFNTELIEYKDVKKMMNAAIKENRGTISVGYLKDEYKNLIKKAILKKHIYDSELLDSNNGVNFKTEFNFESFPKLQIETLEDTESFKNAVSTMIDATSDKSRGLIEERLSLECNTSRNSSYRPLDSLIKDARKNTKLKDGEHDVKSEAKDNKECR